MKFILYLYLIMSSNYSFEEDGKIKWDSDKRLNWQDYKGKPDDKSEYSAITSATITYQLIQDSSIDSLTCIAYTIFNCNKSWVMPNAKNQELLIHEQTHFDIFEVYSRIFKERIATTIFESEFDSTELEINKIYNATFRECMDFQKKYDMETNLGLLDSVQLRYTSEIDEKLKVYSLFAADTVKILYTYGD